MADPTQTSADMQATVAALQQIAQTLQSSGVDKWAASMKEFSDAGLKAKSSLDEALERMGLIGQSYQHMLILSEANNFQNKLGNEILKERNLRVQEEIELHDSVYTKMKRDLELWQEKLWVTREWNREFVKGVKTADETGHALANVRDTASKFETFITGLPGGGILSFFLMGIRGDAQVKGEAQEVVQMFDRIGAGAQSLEGRIQSLLMAHKLYNNMSAADLKAAAGSFATSGIGWQDATMARGSMASLGLRDNMLEATIQLDKFLELSSGSTAKMMGTAVRDFGNTIEDSIDTYVRYGFAARQAGWDMGTFMNEVTGASQNLKFYNVQLDDMAGRMLRAQQIGEGMGFSKQHAAAWASSTLGQVNGQLTNMGAGMTVWIGREVGAAMAEWSRGRNLSDSDREAIGNLGGSPISTLVQMKHGAQGILDHDAQAKFWGTTIGTLADKAMQAGHGNKDVAEYFLTTQGYSWEAARLILRLKDQVDKQGNLDPSHAGELQKALRTEAEKTSSMERMMKALEVGLVQVANGLLGAILMTLKSIVMGTLAIVEAIAGNWTESKAFGAQALESLTGDKGAMGYGKQIGEGLKNMVQFFDHAKDVDVIGSVLDMSAYNKVKEEAKPENQTTGQKILNAGVKGALKTIPGIGTYVAIRELQGGGTETVIKTIPQSPGADKSPSGGARK